MILKNSIKITFRKLKHQPVLGLLKIGGVGISMGLVVLMLLYIDFQWQYDRFHKNGDRIYRISTDQYKEGKPVIRSAMTYAGIGPLMKTTLPGVENQVRLAKWIANDIVFQYKDNAVREQNFFFTESSFFEVFSLRLKRGDPETALKEPRSVVLTEKVARKLFGMADPMGQELKMESRTIMKVTGVIEDVPIQSHLEFGMLASYSTWQGTGFADEGVYGDNHFSSFYTYTYVLLYPEVDPVDIGLQLTELVTTRKKVDLVSDVFTLQQLYEIHLYSDLQYELKASGGGVKIWILLGISMLILVLTWANYFNLSVAYAFELSKSIAIEKLAGANQLQIAGQLFIENLFVTTIGWLIGVIMAITLTPSAEYLFEIELSNMGILADAFHNPFGALIILISATTLLSSLLPALALSFIRPVQLIHKTFTISRLGINIQKGLVIFQFTIIIGLLAASIAVFKQTQHMQHKDPGINLSNILIVKGPLGTSIFKDVNAAHVKFHNKLTTMAAVSNVASSHKVPGQDLEIVNEIRLKGADGFFSFNRVYVTPSFFELYELPFLVGKAPAVTNEKHNRIVINEAAMLQMGFQDPYQVLGKHLIFWESEYEIIGVIKNYHHLSLHRAVTPIMIDLIDGNGLEDGYFSIKMRKNNYGRSIDKIRETFKSVYPHTVFEYFDLEEYYYHQYKADIDFRTLSVVFTALSFLVACLGLFALSVITMNQRRKEVGIRKILGSSVEGIVVLLSKDFIKLVLFGWIIAMPIAWYAISAWLQNFPYRIAIEWWIFLAAASIAVGTALLTISFNAIKTATSNPVDILREG